MTQYDLCILLYNTAALTIIHFISNKRFRMKFRMCICKNLLSEDHLPPVCKNMNDVYIEGVRRGIDEKVDNVVNQGTKRGTGSTKMFSVTRGDVLEVDTGNDGAEL